MFCDSLFGAKLAELNKIFPDGLYDYLKAKSPGLYQAIKAQDEEINKIWRLVETKQAEVSTFEQALNAWFSLHQRALRLFKRQGG